MNSEQAGPSSPPSMPPPPKQERPQQQHVRHPSSSSQRRSMAHVGATRTRSRSSTLTGGGGTLGLARTPSHQEVYDADTRSFDGEFGAPRTTFHRHDSLVGRHASSQSTATTPKTFKERVERMEERDARIGKEDKRVLEDVQSGHSGEEELQRQEEMRMQQAQGDETPPMFDVTAEQSHEEASNKEKTDSYNDDEEDVEKQSRKRKEGKDDDDDDDDHQQHNDEDLVTWDTEDSMENPRNWSLHRRWAVIAIVSSYTFLSPLSSSMIAPALQLISQQFHITSTVEQSLMLSVFVLAYAIGPMILGPLSEMFGRRIVLQASNVFFIVFTVACAVAQDRVQLSIFRFFAGLGGSAPLSIGGGTVSDLMSADERGTAMAMYSLGPLLGPAIGPIIGGWIVQRTGNWRWIFGVASIAAGVTATIGLFILPETYAPRILAKKAAKLRKETGNEKLHTIFDRKGTTFIQRLEHNLIRPFILLGTQPVIIILSLYMMIMYGTMYLVLTTFESVFRDVYHESVGIASLNYISLALGFTIGGQIGGRLIDRFYKRLRAKNDGQGQPEFKLIIMMCTCWCLPAGLIIYGWSAQYAVHWIVPNIGAALPAVGMLTNFQCIQNFIVDSYSIYAASAIAAVVFLRSMAGFALPLAGPTMYSRLGYGWGNTVLAFISAVIGIPAPFLLFRYGPYLRAKSRYAATPFT